MGIVEDAKNSLEETLRQVELMIDMAEQNISEFADCVCNAEDEANAKDLADDLDAVRSLIKHSPLLYVTLRKLSTVVTLSDLAFCQENVFARMVIAKADAEEHGLGAGWRS